LYKFDYECLLTIHSGILKKYVKSIAITAIKILYNKAYHMERVRIGSNYLNQPRWKLFIGVPLVYLPLISSKSLKTGGVHLIMTRKKNIAKVLSTSHIGTYIP